jgi:hypothetical protein
MDPAIKVLIDRISRYLNKIGMTTKELHEVLDENHDGNVDKREFL